MHLVMVHLALPRSYSAPEGEGYLLQNQAL
jgi:hypothetical protein